MTYLLEYLKQVGVQITLDDILCVLGVALLAAWLLRTSLGRRSLNNSRPRRTDMPPYLPFVPFFCWFGSGAIAALLIVEPVALLGHLDESWAANLASDISAVMTVAVTVLLARATFARRLRGFGLDLRNIAADLAAAPVNLLAILPLVEAMFLVTLFVGKLVYGGGFNIAQHEELKLITETPDLPLKVLIFFSAVVVAPLMEEVLFRGMFQSMIRSFVVRPWPAIVMTSLLFASVHENYTHWPALFALSLCLGYAYEKSGSLFRPIFIHALFNGWTLVAALYGQ